MENPMGKRAELVERTREAMGDDTTGRPTPSRLTQGRLISHSSKVGLESAWE